MQIDPPLLDVLPTDQVNQSVEKEERATPLVQGRGVYASSGCSPVHAAKQVRQTQHPHPKIFSAQVPPSTKQLITSNSDNTNQGLASSSVLGPNSPHQSVPSSVINSSNHRMLMHPQPQVQLQPKLIKSQAALQKVLQRNSANPDPPSKLQSGETQSEQRNTCNAPPIGNAVSQDCNDSTNAAEVSTPSATQVKAADPSLDSMGTPTNSAGSETVPEVVQGVSRKQSSGSSSPIGHDASVQSKQKLSQLHPPLPVTQPQLLQEQQQVSSLQNSDQTQVMQVGNRSLSATPDESRTD